MYICIYVVFFFIAKLLRPSPNLNVYISFLIFFFGHCFTTEWNTAKRFRFFFRCTWGAKFAQRGVNIQSDTYRTKLISSELYFKQTTVRKPLVSPFLYNRFHVWIYTSSFYSSVICLFKLIFFVKKLLLNKLFTHESTHEIPNIRKWYSPIEVFLFFFNFRRMTFGKERKKKRNENIWWKSKIWFLLKTTFQSFSTDTMFGSGLSICAGDFSINLHKL